MPGRFSLPARRPRSWPPPRISAVGSALPVTTSAPIPGGPPSLCAERLIRSAPISADRERQLAGALHRVAMEEGAMGMRERGDFGDRLNDPGLVVGEHDRHDRRARVGGELPVEPGQIDDPLAVDRDPFGARHGPQHRAVLDRGDEDALAPGAEQRQMVGFGAAADEDDPLGRRADQRRHRFARARSTPCRAARPQRCTEEALPQRASAAVTAAPASGRSGAVAFQSR